ncbi:MAG: DUF2142 domain-containing protein [Chloroflexi bacterium]|nr:DUF2142 domain-containing protein [Chloroflexota bacterium]
MTLSRDHPRIALAIALGFALLSTLYSLINPILESPDEVYHYPYIKHLADGQGLPIQRSDQETLWEQEGSQPPLYYALAALLTWWIDTDDLPIIRRLNPHARIGIPLAEDNKNMVIHTERERWPWRGTTLAVHLVRLFSVLMGSGTVYFTYKLALALYPDRPALAIGAMGLNAAIPMFLFISSSVNNDNLINLLASVVVWLLIRRLGNKRFEWRSLPLIGVLVGLACLSKLSGLALLPLSAFALGLDRAWRLVGPGRCPPTRREIRREMAAWLLEMTLVWSLAALVAGWWYVRNWQLYGDATGLNRMLEIFGRRANNPGVGELWSEFQGFRISFWGLFGVVNVLMRPLWVYYVLDGISILAAVGLVGWAVKGVRARRSERIPALLTLAAWIGGASISLLRWTSLTKASQGRLVYPAISAISLFLALGLLQWVPRKHRDRVAPWLGAPWLLLSLIAPLSAIAPAYARPRILAAHEIPPSTAPYHATYEDKVRLIAYQIERTPTCPGEAVEVKLYWESLAPIEEDFSLYIHLFGRHGAKIGQRDSYHGGGNYPTSQWSVGQIITDRYLVPVDPQAEGPVAAELEVGLYRLATMKNLPVRDAAGQAVGRPVITRVKINGPARSFTPTQRLEADLGHRVQLIGYDLYATSLRPGATTPLTLYWLVLAPLPRDYNVFVHVLDEEGRIVGQGDGPPLDGDYPTSFWGPGETLADTHQIAMRPDAGNGTARVLVGLYHLESGERLPVYRVDGQIAGDAVILTTVSIMDGS